MYLSSGLVVVQVHQTPGIAGVRFLGVQELPGEPHAEAQVHATSTPFPRGRRWSIVQGARVVRVASAYGYVSPAARVHQRVRHTGADHSVHVSRLSTSCKQTTDRNEYIK